VDNAAGLASGRPRLLLVEDDPQLSALLVEVLDEAGFAVDHAADGQAGLHCGLSRRYQLLVLDRRLPALEGLDLLSRLRARGVSAAALMLTARGAVADRVEGLNGGADDYLVKPFEVDELVARLYALLRRHTERGDHVSLAGGELDVEGRQVVWRDRSRRAVALSRQECALLGVLASRPGRAFSRDELRTRVFDDTESARAVDIYVHYLRRKLGRSAVRTVRGFGYQLGSL
jgi:two-component system response regulator QseB